MLEAIKASRFKVKWNLREIHKVTQWKDDCIYRTRSLGMIVCLPDYQLPSKDYILGPVSTKISRELM